MIRGCIYKVLELLELSIVEGVIFTKLFNYPMVKGCIFRFDEPFNVEGVRFKEKLTIQFFMCFIYKASQLSNVEGFVFIKLLSCTM